LAEIDHDLNKQIKEASDRIGEFDRKAHEAAQAKLADKGKKASDVSGLGYSLEILTLMNENDKERMTCLALFVPSDLIEIGLERSFCDAQEEV
jgi:hypothetical protein